MEQERLSRTSRHRAEAAPETLTPVGFLIQAGIDAAHDEHRNVDDTTARLIAMRLAPSITSNLALFAQNGGQTPHTTNALLRTEYLPIYAEANTDDETKELIDWLGVYLVDRENGTTDRIPRPAGRPHLENTLWNIGLDFDDEELAVSIRADLSTEALTELPARLAPLLAAHGDAFKAYLQLPGVEASSTQLEESFRHAYRGSFEWMDEVVTALTDAPEVEEALEELRQTYQSAGYLSFDREGLGDFLSTWVYDVITVHNTHHVFEK